LLFELDSMKGLLEESGGSDMLDVIRAEMSAQLATIRGLIGDGQIFPQCNFRLSQKALSCPRMPLEASSTSIRKSIAGQGALEKFATLPYSVFRYIRRSALYLKSSS
jgi:hypothetical protein